MCFSTTRINSSSSIQESLEESSLLIKGVNETMKQKGRFLTMSLGTLGASLLGCLLTGKGIIRAGERTIRAGQDF